MRSAPGSAGICSPWKNCNMSRAIVPGCSSGPKWCSAWNLQSTASPNQSQIVFALNHPADGKLMVEQAYASTICQAFGVYHRCSRLLGSRLNAAGISRSMKSVGEPPPPHASTTGQPTASRCSYVCIESGSADAHASGVYNPIRVQDACVSLPVLYEMATIAGLALKTISTPTA
jgi:hypothetical protein